jgi:hypothetical protein
MSEYAHQIPAQNWIAEPPFLRIYLRPLHRGHRSDIFLIYAERKDWIPTGDLTAKGPFGSVWQL